MINLKSSVTAQEINAIRAMTNEARADLAARINATDPFTIFDNVEGKEGKQIVCPFCGSGSGKNHTGITPVNSGGVWLYHCFAGNDCEGTLTRIIADANNISTRGKDFFEVLAIGANITRQIISAPADETFTANKKTTSAQKSMEKKKTNPIKEAAAEYERLAEAQKNLSAFIEKQGGKWRGLSLETLQHMKAGFLPYVYFPAAKKELPAIVIPNDLNGVYFRAIEGKYHKNNKPSATTTIFLPDAEKFDLIVTEGQINAASIFQAVQEALYALPDFGIIASGGTSGNSNVLNKIQELKSGGKNIRVFVAYDNDTNNAGNNSATKLIRQLKKAGIKAYTIDITKTSDTDLNDVLREKGGYFKLFDMFNLALSEIPIPTSKEEEIIDTIEKEIPDTPIADSNFETMYEAKSDDRENEKDSFEIEKERVIADRLDDPELDKFFIPYPYEVTRHGIKFIGKKEIKTICPRPILIKEKFFNLEEQTYKLQLEYLTATGKWKTIQPKGREIIFHKNKITDLAAYGLPVTSGNAAQIVDFLFNLDLANERYTPLTYTVNRCGWYTFSDKKYFIDPRITNTIEDDGRKINITVDSASHTATALKTKGTLDEWKRAYNLAAKSTIARVTVAASIAAPLLKILNERNFVFYVHGKTRSGKSTALYLGASAVGSKEMVRVFDGTNNGLTAMAAETNDYGFFVDEKQAADPKLRNDFQRWIYSDANGTERTRANKDGTVKPARTWQHITICNGETELLDDTATGGAHTRLLQVHAPDTILDSDTCKEIRQIIENNYGHALPIFIDAIKKLTVEKIEKLVSFFQDKIEEKGTNILPEHIKYLSIICAADTILNAELDNSNGEIDYNALLESVPTIEEIDDTAREENIVSAFIAMKAAHFEGNSNYNKDRGLDVFGKHKDGYLYIIAQVLNKYLEDNGCDYKKLINDLVASGYFIPADKADKDRKTPRFTVNIWINGKNQRCYKIETELSGDFPPQSVEE